LHSHPNIRGSLLMAAATAAFTMNDTITKSVSAELNIVMGHGRIVFEGTPAEFASNGAIRKEWLEV
jgi:ABC-type branched-subunit amino acid transport system ATPase component